LQPGDVTHSGIGEVYVRRRGLVGERWIGVCPVDVVALHALIESSEAAAEHGFAVAKQVVGEADTRLPRLVVVLDDAAREAAHARKLNAIHVERGAVDRCKSGAGRSATGRKDRG
jgi:hypothetical protein